MFFWKKPAAVEPSPHQVESLRILNRILDGMGVNASMEILSRDDRLLFKLACGEDDSVVIGRKGKTLESIQFLVNRMVGRTFPDEKPVVIDVSGYRERRLRNLTELSRRSVERVLDTGHAILVGPYNAYERHIIHNAVKETDHRILTESQGEGDYKTILLKLRSSEDLNTGD
jgi:spoIIIJ-associated protein